jgi:hypothetical protein
MVSHVAARKLIVSGFPLGIRDFLGLQGSDLLERMLLPMVSERVTAHEALKDRFFGKAARSSESVRPASVEGIGGSPAATNTDVGAAPVFAPPANVSKLTVAERPFKLLEVEGRTMLHGERGKYHVLTGAISEDRPSPKSTTHSRTPGRTLRGSRKFANRAVQKVTAKS